MGEPLRSHYPEVLFLDIELEPTIAPVPEHDWFSLLGFCTIYAHILICYVIKYFFNRLREPRRQPTELFDGFRDLITDAIALTLAFVFVMSGLPEHPDRFKEWWSDATRLGPRVLRLARGWPSQSFSLALVAVAAIVHRLASPWVRGWVRGMFPKARKLGDRRHARGTFVGRKGRRRNWRRPRNM